MQNWKDKLAKFLNDFEHSNDIIGILVCGSYITGNPTSHSDLDVHIILDDNVDYRERGNKIVDGLLIEYFANPPKQIRKYFREDYRDMCMHSPVQFATGLILEDKAGEVQKLKNEAKELIKINFADLETRKISELIKYAIWDMLDDLEDAFDQNRQDFDFLYYNNLHVLIKHCFALIKQPYDKKAVLGNITNEKVREKYLLNKLNDTELETAIFNAITKESKQDRLLSYTTLTKMFFDKAGGFDIDKFRFKSGLDV